jgi:perosamine synthetase
VRVPIVRPDLGDEEIEAVARVIRSGWIMQGPEVAAFEADFAAAVGAPHAVAVSSCTTGLELVLRALGIGAGDEVVTVSHSFIATANAVVAVGARPVFVDIEERTLGMDPAGLAAARGPRTRAVLCAHQLGIPCDLEGILDAARGLPVIEDAACALGSEWRGARIGRPHGLVAVFSFHPRKVVTTGDGGMITTRDRALADRLRLLRQHGLEGGAFLEPAHNFRMTDLQAAIARPQLARLDRSLADRRRIAARFSAALTGALRPPPEHPGTNWQSYPAQARDGAAAVAALERAGIGARGGVSNAHEEPAYRGRDLAGVGPLGLAVSERMRQTTVMLPIFQGMTPAEEDAVIAASLQIH